MTYMFNTYSRSSAYLDRWASPHLYPRTMNRFIQIVYDNSGSMNCMLQGKPKYHLAQELFDSEILPQIALPGDRIVLRTFQDSCEAGNSKTESLTDRFGQDRNRMLTYLKTIPCEQSTPLYFAVYDAILACSREQADEYRIFVLTDGDDTCGMQLTDLFSQEVLDRYVKAYHIQFLLVALAVESPLSRNNLSALSSRLGGQFIALSGSGSLDELRHTLRQGLQRSGYGNAYPLEPCFTTLPGPDRSWPELEAQGLLMFHAELLHQKGYLSFRPDRSRPLSPLQVAEMKFLSGLCFASQLPDNLVSAMLSQLQKPYRYGFDCIYWDFGAACWKHFPKPPALEAVPNPEALQEDLFKERVKETSAPPLHHRTEQVALLVNDPYAKGPIEGRSCTYAFDHPYRVTYGETEAPSFTLVEETGKAVPGRLKTLYLDEVILVREMRSKRGRKPKSASPSGS